MTTLSPNQKKLKLQVVNHWKFKLFLLKKLPMGLLAGIRIRNLEVEKCITSVPFKWLTKNPFKSMYFAVQSMAAELSTAAPCMVAAHGHRPSIAFIIVGLKATFHKKATGRIFFTCKEGIKAFEAVERAKITGEAQTVTLKTEGKMKDGTLVSEFELTWSFKQRSS